jgi:hypothetical protein
MARRRSQHSRTPGRTARSVVVVSHSWNIRARTHNNHLCPYSFCTLSPWCTWWCQLTDGIQVEITQSAQLEDKLPIRLLGGLLPGTVASFPPTDPQGVAGAQEKPLLLLLLPE